MQSPGGARFAVAAPYADRFAPFLRDLEASGYAIKTQESGGYNPRFIAGTTTPSMHASGRAVDVNWGDNARGTAGNIDPALARNLSAKHGLTWGGDWRNPDPMHFEASAKGPLMRDLPTPANAANEDEWLDPSTAGPAPSAPSAPPQPTAARAPQPGERPMGEQRSGLGLFGDVVSDTVMSPLFLAGAGLLTGNDFGTAMQAAQVGAKFQADRRQQREKDQAQAGIRDAVYSSPTFAGMTMAERDMLAKNPQMAQSVLGQIYQHRFDPQAKLKTELMQGQIAQTKAETEMFPLKADMTRAHTDLYRAQAANKENSEAVYAQRARQAQAYGLTPDHPAFKPFVLTGKMPREDQQPLTATDKKAIIDAE
ncbi:MAG: M15 family metallopeptidase, partial [Hyphomicrobiales bacterium]|nr:M15 family metallopeptidase [Hyphomicrobiales bacterium]